MLSLSADGGGIDTRQFYAYLMYMKARWEISARCQGKRLGVPSGLNQKRPGLKAKGNYEG